MLSINIAHKILDDAARPRNEAKTLERKETSVVILTVRFKTVREYSKAAGFQSYTY